MIGLVLAGLALAQSPDEASDPRGLPIASVALEAPRGGLPEESLEALLRAAQGVPYDPQLVRLDLTTLFRVGEFSAVEADVSPWVVFDASGESQPAVTLTYRVYPAPRVDRVRVQGNRSFPTRKVLEAAGITPGQVFYPDLDGPAVEARVVEWLKRQGWVNAAVEVDPLQVAPDVYEVWLRIGEGRPNVLTEMAFVGDIPVEVGEETLRRWARSSGIREGKPISQEAIANAQFEMRSKIARVTGGLFRPRRGWINARVSPAVSRDDDGSVTLTWAIEPGPRLDLAVVGLKWRPKKKVRDALGIDERLRLTRGFVDEAPDRMQTYLRRTGFYAATATVELRGGSEELQTLLVEIDRGARHSLRGQPPRRSLTFVGNEAVGAAALTRVADQASESVIRLDYFTEEELESGFSAIKNLYRTRGYQDVQLELTDVSVRPLGNALTRPFVAFAAALLGNPAPKRILPTITVTEGPLTTQRLAGIAGAAQGVDVSDLEDELDRLSGEPFDPLAVERVAREVVDRHRQAGYLEVDARVRHEAVDAYEVNSIVDVDPGSVVLLRSVVTRGSRITSPALIRREVDLVRGVPLSTTSLETARRRLYDLGIFRTVGTQLLGDEKARDLLITVRERPRWAAEAGFGLNTDQGLRTIGRLTRRNLFGLAHRIDAFALVGVDYRSDSITDWSPDLANIAWRAAISYTAPHFPLRQQDVVADVLLQERRQERTWRMARTGMGVTLDTELGPKTSLQTAVRAERRQLQEVDKRALLEDEPWYGVIVNGDDVGSLGCPRYPCRMAESIRAVLLHDLRDDPVQPKRGLLVSWIAEVAPGLPWQDPSLRGRFVKSEVRLSSFVPIGGMIFRFTGEGGHARAFGGTVVPLEDRFRLGGTGSLRGFTRQSVGPRNLAQRVDVEWPDGIGPLLDLTERDNRTRWIPTGGDTSGVAILELLMPLPALGLPTWEGYSAVVFADVGNVWLLGPGKATTSGLSEAPLVRYGVGVGARVDTPIGPLQLDLATNPARIYSSPQTQALLEAWEEPTVRLHLSLGTLW
ncbi:MAG: BamA/TamA family outer membrane protein [Alphaproteobacteria bacterium]|nr:BamA/TamA family outer membrane protein [Alphaproteobacteria bacterium]